MTIDFPTFPALFRVARDEALSRNSALTLEVIERQGTDANALVAGSAAVGDEAIGQLVQVEAGLYLDSARKKALDRLVFDRYGLLRKPASAALTSVEFTTTTANPSAFAIPVGTRIQTSDGRMFITTASDNFPLASFGPISVAVRSVLAGLSQQVTADQLTNLIDKPSGSPDDLVVTNSLASAGADDEESDESLRDRARRFFTTARRGTAAAVEAAALAYPGVRTASTLEFTDSFGRPCGAGALLITDAFTQALVNVTPTPAEYTAQSQVLAQAVFDSLSDTRAMGVYVQVIVASIVLQSVKLALSFKSGVDVDAVALQARAAVINYMNVLPPGAAFVINTAVQRLRSVPGLIVTGTEFISPVGNVVPQPLQALRTNLALVLASSLQPDQALQGSANPDV